MKKTYITTSIAYTNALPHIGFGLELIQADVAARYYRSLGKAVWFLTGTDEHGEKVAKKAQEEGKDPGQFCDEIAQKFIDLTRLLNISNDDFIRTTDQERHWPGVTKMWETLKANGDIYEKNYEGLYCLGCEAFIVPRDLIKEKCPYHGKEPEPVKEKNYFFKLSKYSDRIEQAVISNQIEIIPPSRKKEILGFIDRGLEDVSFSRPVEKVKWGIPVPGDSTQSVYVWGDALTNYISAIGYGRNDDYKNIWPADIQFVGKDIIKFHALIWPAMLMSADLDLPRKIFVHGFLNFDGRKMSKSLGNIIDPFELVEKYGVDPVRYYFLRELNPNEDGDFSYDKFEERYNADLASGLGNLVSRVVTLARGIYMNDSLGMDIGIQKEIDETSKKCLEYLNELKFNLALAEIWALLKRADRYIETNRPWEKEREGREEVIYSLTVLLSSVAKMINPFMPETSDRVLKFLSNKEKGMLFKKID